MLPTYWLWILPWQLPQILRNAFVWLVRLLDGMAAMTVGAGGRRQPAIAKMLGVHAAGVVSVRIQVTFPGQTRCMAIVSWRRFAAPS
jgi:hypothetical protein